MRAPRWVPASLRGFSLATTREAFRVFRPAVADQRRPIAALGALSLVLAAVELLRPWPVKLVLDRVLLRAGDGPVWLGLSRDTTLVVAVAATVLIPFLIGTISMRVAVGGAEVGRKVSTRIRRQVFQHLHRLEFPFHQENKSGDLLVRLMGDVNMVRDLLFASWINLLQRAAVFAATAVVMVVLDPLLAVLAFAPVPVLLIGLTRSSAQLKELTRKQRRREGDAASFAAESLRQMRVVKAYAAEQRATEQFARDARAGERAGVKAARVAARMGRTSEVLSGAGLGLVLFIGARRVLGGAITAGDLVVFMSYVRAVYRPVRKVTGEGARLSKASACAARLLEVLRRPPEPTGVGREAPPFHGELVVRNLHVTHRGGAQALRGLSLEVKAGQLAVIAGPNGSGKSTLLTVLLRLVTADSGVVLLDGQPIHAFGLDCYRRRFAYMPQETQLFGASVRDNVLYGRPDASPEEVEEAARLAMLSDVLHQLPDGLDTVIGEGGCTLSGGQARRVMLARAAVRDARLVLLDEPLAGLDPDARILVAQGIRRVALGRTTLVVSHDLPPELDPHVVFRLADGRLVATEELRAAGDQSRPAREARAG